MENILFIHDNSPRSRKCLDFAASLAARLNARLVLGLTRLPQYAGSVKVLAGSTGIAKGTSTLPECFEIEQNVHYETDISAMDARELAQFVNKEEIGMVIKCAAENREPETLKLDSLVSRLHCPLLLIPGNWAIKDLERIVYLADLRYCRYDVTRYLAHLAKAFGASLSVAHLTKEGMVHIEKTYAHRLFEEQVRSKLKYDRLGFHYTRERDVIRATDVLVKGLHHDLLVMTHNRYHFKQLIAQALNSGLPLHIQAPLLIFPG